MQWVSGTLQEDQAGGVKLFYWEGIQVRSNALCVLVKQKHLTRHSQSCQRLCWRWWRLLSPGKPAAAGRVEGCFRCVPTGWAAGGEETEPCRRREWSWSGSLATETSPGRRTAQTLQDQGTQEGGLINAWLQDWTSWWWMYSLRTKCRKHII